MKTADLLEPGETFAPPRHDHEAMQPIDWIEALDIERVEQRDVEYLCFEGGGGKGIIFLGAVHELERRGVLTYSGGRIAADGQIKGIAGSSAGALTAVLLSCGYNHAFLNSLLFGNYSFNRFFDLPDDAMPRPTVTGCQPTPSSTGWSLIGRGLNSLLRPSRRARSRSNAEAGAMTKLSAFPGSYVLNMVRHWGLFSGCASRDLFAYLIANKAASLKGHAGNYRPYLNMTFAQHYETFRCKLVLTGSNFSTGKTGFFSAETTPNFPVATAARISMGLPLIFKPVLIGSSTARQYAASSSNERNMSAAEMTGVWVDGGYFNNLPQQAFVHEPNGFAHTLGFTLSGYGSQRRRISHLGQFLLAYVNHGLFGGGESQISASTGIAPNTVPLVAGDRSFEIGTTRFAFTSAELPHVRRLIGNARQATGRYFGRP